MGTSSKSEALKKHMGKSGCKKCGKPKEHRMHRDKEASGYHAYGLANDMGKPEEGGDEAEAKEEE